MQADLRIRNRRLYAAARVSRRARISACAFRPDLQRARIVHPRDAAAAGADHMDVYHRRLHRVIGNQPARTEQRLAAIDQRHVGAGTADVERDEVFETGDTADFSSAHHTCSRPRQTGAHRVRAHCAHRHQAAVGMYGERLDGDAKIFDTLEKAFEIGFHARADRRIQQGRRPPLVLAEFRQHVARYADISIGQHAFHHAPRRLLVRRIAIGMQKAHGDRFDAGRFKALRCGLDFVLVERRNHRAT